MSFAKKAAKQAKNLEQSLEGYLKEHGCFFCRIPERKEVEQAYLDNQDTRHILLFLIERRGYKPEEVLNARTQIGTHFTRHCAETALYSLKRGGRR